MPGAKLLTCAHIWNAKGPERLFEVRRDASLYDGHSGQAALARSVATPPAPEVTPAADPQ